MEIEILIPHCMEGVFCLQGFHKGTPDDQQNLQTSQRRQTNTHLETYPKITSSPTLKVLFYINFMWTYFSEFLRCYKYNQEIKNHLLDLKNSLAHTKGARAQLSARKFYLVSFVKLHFLQFRAGLES